MLETRILLAFFSTSLLMWLYLQVSIEEDIPENIVENSLRIWANNFMLYL